jgi:hypothetical protein
MMIERGVMSSEEKLELLEGMVPKSVFASRSMIKLGLEMGSMKVWDKIVEIPVAQIVDLLWYAPEVKVNKEIVSSFGELNAIMGARGICVSSQKSGLWEIDLLNAIDPLEREKLGVDISFEYLCTSCKQMVPLAFVRCPHCSSLGYGEVQISLCHQQREMHYE